MDISLLDDHAGACLQEALDMARRRHCHTVDSRFLLFACGHQCPKVRDWLKRHGIIAHRLAKGLKTGSSSKPPALSSELVDVLELAEVLAGGEPVTPLHLLAAMLFSDPTSRALNQLRGRGLKLSRQELFRDLQCLLPSLP